MVEFIQVFFKIGEELVSSGILAVFMYRLTGLILRFCIDLGLKGLVLGLLSVKEPRFFF